MAPKVAAPQKSRSTGIGSKFVGDAAKRAPGQVKKAAGIKGAATGLGAMKPQPPVTNPISGLVGSPFTPPPMTPRLPNEAAPLAPPPMSPIPIAPPTQKPNMPPMVAGGNLDQIMRNQDMARKQSMAGGLGNIGGGITGQADPRIMEMFQRNRAQQAPGLAAYQGMGQRML